MRKALQKEKPQRSERKSENASFPQILNKRRNFYHPQFHEHVPAGFAAVFVVVVVVFSAVVRATGCDAAGFTVPDFAAVAFVPVVFVSEHIFHTSKAFASAL